MGVRDCSVVITNIVDSLNMDIISYIINIVLIHVPISNSVNMFKKWNENTYNVHLKQKINWCAFLWLWLISL